eukprot:RCo019551
MNKEINDPAISPAAIFFYQMVRHFKMGEGNDRFNIIFQQLIKECIIKFQTFFIRFLFITIWKYACPGDRGAETFKTHFGEESDIFFKMMIKISRFMVRIIEIILYAISDHPVMIDRTAREHIANTQSFAAQIVPTFNLMSCNCATPQEIVR